MSGYFWSNTIWYCLLAFVTSLVAVYVFVKSANKKFLLGFGFAVLGLTFIFETGLLTLFNSYKYNPKISSDPFLDSIIGNYFSQFSLTITGLLFLIFKPAKIWYLLIATLYFVIEEVFLKLGIYEHLWYRTWYTFVLVLLLLWITNIWYRYLICFPKKFVYYLTLFLGASAIFSVTVVFFLYTFKIQVFHNVIFPNAYYRNQAILIVSYRTISVLLMMILYHMKWKWWWKGVMLGVIFGLHTILVEMGVQSFKSGFFYIASFADIIGSYTCVALIAHWLKQGREENNI